MRKLSLIFVSLVVLGCPLIASAAQKGAPPPAHKNNFVCEHNSPFQPDPPDENTIVLDCADGLDTWSGQGTDMPITRSVGDNPLASAQFGFLGQYAIVKLASQHCPYNDDFGIGANRLPITAIKLNGHFIGNLLPGNAILNQSPGTCTGWTITTFQVPVQYLNFPVNFDENNPPVPSINHFEFDDDTLYKDGDVFGWSTEVDWISVNFAATRPILLVHGILSSSATWFPLWYTNLTAAHQPFRAITLPGGIFGYHGMDSIETDAGAIAQAVATMKKQFGVDKINIVAHSRGGIDSRHYVEFNNDVEQVIQLGTPNAGSPLADYIYDVTSHIPFLQKLIDKYAPIEYILTTHYMKDYDRVHGHNENVRYTSIAGVWHPHWYDLSLDHLLAIIVGKGDTIVPRWSVEYLDYAHKIEFNSYGGDKSATHTHLTSSPALYAVSTAILQVKTPTLVPQAAGSDPLDDPAVELPNASKAKTIGGKLHGGETTIETLNVDESKPISFSVVFPDTDSVSLRVISPSGQAYDANSVYPANAGYELSDLDGQPMATIHFDQPETGAWQVQVRADVVNGISFGAPGQVSASSVKPGPKTGRNDDTETEYVLTMWMAEPSRTLAVALDKTSIPAGQNFRLKATLKNGGMPMTGVPVTAEVAMPDTSTRQLVLHDDGLNGDAAPNDGIYTADFTAPLPGVYNIKVSADENRPGAVAFSREEYVVGNAAASHTQVAGPFTDTAFATSPGLWDTLRVTGTLNIDTPGKYYLLGTLSDAQGNVVVTAAQTVNSGAAGSLPVGFNFQGQTINVSRVSGPYQFGVRVAEDNGQALAFTQDDANLYTTSPYFYYQFKGPSDEARTPTVITVTPVTIQYGSATDVTAVLTADGLPVQGKTLNFAMVGQLGSATTDFNGVATIHHAPIPNFVAPGSYLLSASFIGDQAYQPVASTAPFNIYQGVQTITWANPADIAPGTPLGPQQLNAIVKGSGSAPGGDLTYDPPADTILPFGDGQTLTVTAADNGFYGQVTATVAINVRNPSAAVNWSNPADITYGTPLSATQLNATATAPGTFVYSPAAGTVLNAGANQTLSVTFFPSNGAQPSTKSVSINVLKAPQTIQWARPAAIVYGTPLSVAQLNATTNGGGALTYTPAAGTILDAGTQTLTVNAAATANYGAATATVSIDVNKANPTISWSNPADVVYGTPLSATQLNATVNSGGALTYAPSAGAILGAGTHTLTVTAGETANYVAGSKSVTINVAKATSVITWAAPAGITYPAALSATQLDATANVPGTFVYTPPAGTVLNAGNGQTLSVQFAPADSDNYQSASATTTINVAKAKQTITWSSPAPIVYGTPLSAVQLNATTDGGGALTYSPPAGTIPNAGIGQTLTVNAAASQNYEAASASVTIDVLKAKPVLTWAAPASIVYGTALDAAQLDATANVAGSFTYTPAAGTILNAGNAQTLSAHFTPNDAHNYDDATASVTIDVAKAKQTLTWTAPSPIVYGTPLSAAQLDAGVSVVGPAPAGALVYAPAAGTVLDAGSRTLSVNALETANYLPATMSVSITVNRAPLALTVDAKSKLYGAAVPTLTGTLSGVVNGDSFTPSYATSATAQSPAATYPITATLIDPANRLINYNVTITLSTLTILPAPLQISANAATKQYSDPLPQFGATFTGFVLGENPAVLGGTLSITTTATPLSAPGTYPIAIGGLTSTNYAIVYAGSTLTVTQEDARVTVTSPLTVSGANVTLIATVKDISATADANGDTYPGDITKATLTFVDRATNSVLCTAPIALVSASDLRIGVATCTFPVTTPSVTVGSRIGGYYVRDAAADDVVVTIVPATNDWITGGGTLSATDSFTINLQYDKNANVKGNFTYAFQRTEGGAVKKYELTATSIASLTIQRTKEGGTAAILGSGTLVDVTTATNPVVLDTAAPLIITATDAGEPATKDSIGITLLKKDGGIWVATGWNGTRAVEQSLTGGNIVVHYAK